MGTSDTLLGVALRWTSITSRGEGGVAILSVASCYRNRDKLRPCGPPWLVCDLPCSRRSTKTFLSYPRPYRALSSRSIPNLEKKIISPINQFLVLIPNLGQNSERISRPYTMLNCLKTIPFTAAQARIAFLWKCDMQRFGLV